MMRTFARGDYYDEHLRKCVGYERPFQLSMRPMDTDNIYPYERLRALPK
jgi:hypothetical protein